MIENLDILETPKEEFMTQSSRLIASSLGEFHLDDLRTVAHRGVQGSQPGHILCLTLPFLLVVMNVVNWVIVEIERRERLHLG
jgi:hypothetical protein